MLTRAPAPPEQVASHAQKYFIRLNSQNKKDKRRASIHDITTVASAAAAEASGHMGGAMPITGTGAMPHVAAGVPVMGMPGGMPRAL